MNHFKSLFPIRRISSLLTFTAIVAAMPMLSACTSPGGFLKTADSPLPIETKHSPSGQIASFRAFETSGRLVVAGNTKSGYANPAAHVDIQLIGRDGKIIATGNDGLDSIHPRTARARSGRHSYVASFPLSEAKQATGVRIVFHSDRHSPACIAQG